MLLEFSCSNHKSIRDKAVLSCIAASDPTMEEQIQEIDGLRIMKSAMIYGAAGTGKSNLIDAVSFMKNLVIHSITNQPGTGIHQTPHHLEGFSKESTYQIQFTIQDVRYVYGFSIRNLLVEEEYLYFFPKQKQTKLFDRKGNEFTVGSQLRRRFGHCKDVLKPNRLLLSCAANFTAIKEIADVFAFFTDDLIICSADQNLWLKNSLAQMDNDVTMKRAVLTTLQDFGIAMKDIRIKMDEEQNHIVQAKAVYEKFETDLFHEESDGVKKLIAIICPFLNAMQSGKVLIIDDLDTGFTETIVSQLYRMFMHHESASSAQLIWTTRQLHLLKENLLRRDQIWLMELTDTDRVTDLYSLVEIKTA